MELECGVCYQIYNAGRRCPREMRCKHSFCECCLNLLAHSAAREAQVSTADVPAEVTLVCPLCRYPTMLCGEVRKQLPVDEDLFERMVSSGVLNDAASDDEEDPEESKQEMVPKCEESAVQSNSNMDVVPRSRGKRLWRSFKRFCKIVIAGDNGDRHVLTDEDMRDLVLMSCMISETIPYCVVLRETEQKIFLGCVSQNSYDVRKSYDDLKSMGQQGIMSLGINIRLALVYLAFTGMGVHSAEPPKRRHNSGDFQLNGLQTAQSMEAPDTTEDPMDLPPSGEWMAGFDEFPGMNASPAPRSHSPSRNHIRRYTYSSQSSGSSTPTAIRKSSFSLQTAPVTGNIDSGPVVAVAGSSSSRRPVKSQFGQWGTNQVESGATREGESAKLIAVSEGVSIMRKRGDGQNPSSVVSSPPIKFVAGSQHGGQACADVGPTCRPEAKVDTTTVSKAVAKKPFKESSRGEVRYVMIKPHRRPHGVALAPKYSHKGQGWYSSSLVSSSPNAQSGKVNSPFESRRGQVTQSNKRKAQSVASKEGYIGSKPNAGTRFEPAKAKILYKPYKAVQASSSLTERQPSIAVPFREKATVVGYQGHSKNVGPQMAARPDGLFDPHRSTGDVRKTTRVTSSHSFTVTSSPVRVWTQRKVASTNVNPTVKLVPAKRLNQATRVNKVDVSNGIVSKLHKKPGMLQSVSVRWPQSTPGHGKRILPNNIIIHGPAHSSSGVLGSATNLVSNAGGAGIYGHIQVSKNQYSQPSTASSGKSQQGRDGKFQQSKIEGKNTGPQPQVRPQHSSSSSSVKPGQNTNVKISTVAYGSGLDHIPLTRTDDSKKSAFQTSPGKTGSGVSQSAPRQSEHTSATQHLPSEYEAQNQPSPGTSTGQLGAFAGGKGVLEETKNSRYAPESHSSTFLEQRYQNLKASSAALKGSLSHVHVGKQGNSGKKGMSRKSGALTAIVTGNADYGPKFGHHSTVNSQRREHVPRRGYVGIETRFGYIEVPLAVTTFSNFVGTDGRPQGYSSSHSTLTPAVLKKLSRMARLAQAQTPTGAYVIGTRVRSSSSSKRGKSQRKFKPVGLADIGGSVAFRSKKTRSAPESTGNAASRDPGNLTTLQSTSQSPVHQMTTNDTIGVDESSFIHQTNLLNDEGFQSSSNGQHPEQSQKVQQGFLHDIINLYARFFPKSGNEDDGRSQDEGNQTMMKPANVEENGVLVDGLFTPNGSMAPSAVTHENRSREFDKGAPLDPSSTNLTQSTEPTSGFVAGREIHALESGGRAFISPSYEAEPLQQDMDIMQLKPLNISDVQLNAVEKSVSGPLSDVSDGVNHVQTVFSSTETVQEEAVAGFHLETAKNSASNPPVSEA